MIKVLYDGWSLVYQPNSPEAFHLLTLLDHRPPEVQAILALPGAPPVWLPDGIDTRVQDESHAQNSRLVWEQRRLPELLRQERADLLHLTGAHPPLLKSSRTVLSPGEPILDARNIDRMQPDSLGERFRIALSSGGMSGLRGLFWPKDLSSNAPTGIKTPLYYLSVEPMYGLHSDQWGELADQPQLSLPETYILCPAPSSELAAHRILKAWSWAAGPIGEYYPLLIFGATPELMVLLDEVIQTYQLGNTVRLLPAFPPRLIQELFRKASAVFHPAQAAAWGGIIRLALRNGKPLVAAEGLLTDALVGPAAYLAPGNDTRRLGAGLITVIVEESVSQRLSELALIRARGWESDNFREDLYAAYLAVLE